MGKQKHIDYLNQGKYIKRPHDRQPAYLGHVNYALNQVGGGEERVNVPLTVLDIGQGLGSGYAAKVKMEGATLYFIDFSEINPIASELYIELVSPEGFTVTSMSDEAIRELPPFQIWIKYSIAGTANVNSLEISGNHIKFPLDVNPPFSIGQDAIDCITVQPGVFESALNFSPMFMGIGSLGYPVS